MSSLKFLVLLLVSLGVVTGLAAAGAVAYGREALWEDLFGPPDVGPYSFDKPTRTGKPNDALACPPGACPDVGTVMETHLFAVDAPVLYAAVREEMMDAFRVRMVEEDPRRGHLRAVVFTPLLRLPDTLTAEVRSAAPGRSSLYLYSRSKIGHADLGTNEERLKTLLRHLRWTLPRVAPDGSMVPARKDVQKNAPAAIPQTDAAPQASTPAAPQADMPAAAAPSTEAAPPKT